MRRMLQAGEGLFARVRAHALARSVLLVGAVTVLVKGASAVKDIALAGIFGRGDELEVFLIALLLPAALATIIAEAFAPAITTPLTRILRTDGVERHQARAFLGAMTSFAIGLLLVVSVLLWVAAPLLVPVLASGFSPVKQEMTVWALRLLLLTIGVTGLAGLWTAVLAVKGRLGIASATPAVGPVVMLIYLFVYQTDATTATLVEATIIGALVQALVTGWAVWRVALLSLPGFSALTGNVRQVLSQYGYVVAGSSVMALTVIVDMSMAAMLGPGNVAALSFGGKAPALVMSIAISALGIIVLPHFARVVSSSEPREVSLASLLRQVRWSARWIFALGTFAAVLLMVIADPLITLLLERGNFTGEDTVIVVSVHRMYALQIPFSLMTLIFIRALSAIHANHILTMAAVMNVIVNVILNYIFSRYMGVSGLALSTACVAAMASAFCYFSLRRLVVRETGVA